MAKNYLRIDKFPATGHIESVISKDTELVAGQFVDAGVVQVASEGEVIDVTLTKAGGELDLLVAPVFEGEDDKLTAVTPVGKPVRAYHIQKGDIVSFNRENAKDVKIGDKVAIGANGLGVKAAAPDGADAIGEVISIDYMNVVGELVVVRFL